MRLARVRSIEQANALLETLVPEDNRRFTRAARQPTGARRRLDPGHRRDALLSVRAEGVVGNDCTSRVYQLLKPVYPGERGGRSSSGGWTGPCGSGSAATTWPTGR